MIALDMLTHIDVFSGIGGFTYCLKGLSTPLAYCENDPEAIRVLNSLFSRNKLPRAHIVTDVNKLLIESQGLRKPFMVTAGFPCTGMSSLGNRQGLENKETALIYVLIRALASIRPELVFLECTARTRHHEDKLWSRLSKQGYKHRSCLMSCECMGAPQKRERWFALLYKSEDALQKARTALKNTSLAAFSFKNQPSRTVTSRDNKDYACRYRLLGNSIVPQVGLAAFRKLSGSTPSEHPCLPVNLDLRYRQDQTLFRRPVWPTPRSKNWRTCNKLTYKILQLPSNLKSEPRMGASIFGGWNGCRDIPKTGRRRRSCSLCRWQQYSYTAS